MTELWECVVLAVLAGAVYLVGYERGRRDENAEMMGKIKTLDDLAARRRLFGRDDDH